MIIDRLQNADKYFSVHHRFQKAFEYIRGLDWATLEEGVYVIEGEQLRAIFSNRMGLTVSESVSEFECHNQHIDIQFCIEGKERFGWKPRIDCRLEKGGYDKEKDVQFYDDEPDMFFQLTNGQFVILFPEDVHAPMIGEAEIKKLVVKVKI
jgi:biofilm protein TabA